MIFSFFFEKLSRRSFLRRSSMTAALAWQALGWRKRGADSAIASPAPEAPVDDGPVVVRGPYLQQPTPGSMIVRWRTDVPTSSYVRYGATYETQEMVAGSNRQTTEHEIRLTGLEDSTPYYYSVGTKSSILKRSLEQYLLTAPRVKLHRPTRVWVLGDSGQSGAAAEAVRDAYYNYSSDFHTDLMLLLGDNAYQTGTDDEYQVSVFELFAGQLLHTPVLTTYGNHDAYCSECNMVTESGPYFDCFSPPTKGEIGGRPSHTKSYYSFDHANIHFVCLDSMGAPASESRFNKMISWLDRDLRGTQQEWIIAFWHFPPYTHSHHNSDKAERAGENIRMIHMRERVLPLLDRYDVDLVLCGHNHAYERSSLLRGHYGLSSTLTEAMIVDKGDGSRQGDGEYMKPLRRASGSGTVYVAAGNASELKSGTLSHPAMVKSLSALGSVALDIYKDRIHFAMIGSTGEILDDFTIRKSSPIHLPIIHGG